MEERPVTRSRVIAVIWVVATALAVVITVLYRGDAPGQAALTVVLAVAGAAVAVWLLVRPSAGAIVASALVGVAWLIAYAVLAVIQSDVLAALVTDVGLAVAGAVAAGLSWAARRRSVTPA
jgi:hypothetical protein